MKIKLMIGDRIWYTGDMANIETAGTVTAIHPPTKLTMEGVDIKWDEERFEGDIKKTSFNVPLLAFEPGPGRRFWLLSEWEAERKAMMEAWTAKYRDK